MSEHDKRIDFATLVLLADAARRTSDDAARSFVVQLSGVIQSRFGNDYADEFVRAIGFDHLASDAKEE